MSHALPAQSGQRSSTLNPGAPEWYPKGWHPGSPRSCQAEEESPFQLAELPHEILSCVMSFVGSADDLCRCLMVSQQLKGAVASAPVSLTLADRSRQLLSFPAHAGCLDQLVRGLTRYMPGMRACNLSTLPLEHTHVRTLAQGLRHLVHLDLSACRKLEPSVTKQLLGSLSTRTLRSLNLQRCFQLTAACLTDVLEYAAGSGSGSRALQCVALSHLDLAAWPAAGGGGGGAGAGGDDGAGGARACRGTQGLASEWQQQAGELLRRLPGQLLAVQPGHGPIPSLGRPSASGVRVLVLNNCSMLTAEGLLGLALACPQLEYVFLGGSLLQTPRAAPAGEGAGGGGGAYLPPRAAAAREGGSGPAAAPAAGAELPPALQQLAQLLQLPETLPWEVLSNCCEPGAGGAGSSCGRDGCACACACCAASRAAMQQCGEGSDACGAGGPDQRARKRLCRNEPAAGAVAAARGQALALAYMAALLPGLKAMEVSFMQPGVAGWLRACMARLQQLRAGGGGGDSSAGPKVWQFSCVTAVHDALDALRGARRAASRAAAAPAGCCSEAAPRGVRQHRRRPAGGGGGAAAAAAPLDPACLETAVRCAANCSGRGRSTPLHMAADSGCACHVRALLAAGAAVSARDASGASPMFVAAEAGRAAAAAVLLAAGADCLLGNTAGETPLYIAALRGNLDVVELLLQHLSAAQVDWTSRSLYGDAWTPLMAAAVANRVNVAVCLLRAAAMLCCGSKQAGARLACKPLAAAAAPAPTRDAGPPRPCLRAGSPAAGGSSEAGTAVMRLLAAENRYGQTVLHIAARKGCMELLRLLLLYGAGRVAARVDAAGDTPLDIARRHGHDTAVHELLQQC